MWSLISSLASPKKFFYLSDKLIPWLTAFFILSFSYGMIGGLLIAPADYLQGEGFRIIYVHVPCAFLSLFIYAVMAGAAAAGIIFRLKLAFLVIRHSAPIGAGFTFLSLLTGSLWGKPMWGTWWIWDARLTSELILLFLYLGILLFQSAIAQKPRGERAVAILVLVGFVDIPIIHYSVYWWNTLHQGATLKLFAPSAIDASMLHPLLAMIAAFFMYYFIVLFVRMRYDLTAIHANHHWLRDKR
ncbi:heme ABC transporter permease CcmC [Aquicella lusitana]|uniref:Heme exporter protein C n=1 Tax=Aquicella lusitana TaxID=254246 RepID=A0A370G8R3_9COXI|nr:heme ABC transporter permease CcmC [Aquicella lusitana]RDI40175.1 heme exporter protein C [Aquicella lusitana]VVC72434.1 Heme exporter protein C [Aquicella lusitana]